VTPIPSQSQPLPTQPEYKPTEYLSVVKCASNRRLISRVRTGCHGLRVDTGRWAEGVHLDRTDRLPVSQAVSRVRVVGLCGGRAAFCASVQPYQVTAFGPPAALLYYCRVYDQSILLDQGTSTAALAPSGQSAAAAAAACIAEFQVGGKL